MIQTFIISGRLPGLNDFIRANRASARAGNGMKRFAQDRITRAIKAGQIKPIAGRINVHCTWVEPNMKRDKDNIRFGIKFILDALVEAQIINNDSWTYIGDLSDTYRVNRENPKVIVELVEA